MGSGVKLGVRETVRIGNAQMNACALRLAAILDVEWAEMPETRRRIRGLEKALVLATIKALRAEAVARTVAK